jgi:hypothetical protein
MKWMLLIWISLVVALACSPGAQPDHPAGRKQSEMNHGTIWSVLTLEKAENGATAIHASFAIRNESEEPLAITFNSGQQYDFWLLDGAGTTLWQWSEDKMFTMAIVERTLDREPWVYEETIPLYTREGDPLSDGSYSVRARLTADRDVENQVSFTISGGQPVL